MRRLLPRHSLIIVGALLMLLGTAAVACGGNDKPDSPTPTSTPLVSDRAPTALAPIPPTPTLTQPATSTPTSGSTSSVTPGPTTIVPGPTPTTPGSSSPATTTPGQPTETAPDEPTPTPFVIETGKKLVSEPLGVIQLKPGFGRAVTYVPGVTPTDFRVEVGFKNPFHPDFSAWNYGIKFRDDGQHYQMLVVDHQGNLKYIKGNGPELETVSTLVLADMFTASGIRNDLVFLVIEDRAFVFLAGTLVARIVVEETNQPGALSLVTDIYNQTIVVGAQVEFYDLVINSAGLVAHTASGELIKPSANDIAIGDFSLPTSAGYAKVTFVSPTYAYAGDYSFGLLFRTPATGIDNWLVFNDAKNWRHIRRSTTGAEFEYAHGTADGLLTGKGQENTLEFLSTGQESKVYLNGVLLTNMSIQEEDIPYNMAPMAGFEPTHQTGGMVTVYTDFIVWSVKN
jgi:hypothetical protein